MKYVIPMTAMLAVRTQAEAGAACSQLSALLQQPMIRVMMQSRGVPYEGMHAEAPYPAQGVFAVPLWFFLECPSLEAASQARQIVERLLQEPALRSTARMNGVPLEGASVGEPSVYQPPRR